jgi:hypothetical protein
MVSNYLSTFLPLQVGRRAMGNAETIPISQVFQVTLARQPTVGLVKPGRYHSMNSSSTMLYTRRVIGEETLSRNERLQPLPFRDLFHHNQFGHLGPLIGPYR